MHAGSEAGHTHLLQGLCHSLSSTLMHSQGLHPLRFTQCNHAPSSASDAVTRLDLALIHDTLGIKTFKHKHWGTPKLSFKP